MLLDPYGGEVPVDMYQCEGCGNEWIEASMDPEVRLDQMREAGWEFEPNICPSCQK